MSLCQPTAGRRSAHGEVPELPLRGSRRRRRRGRPRGEGGGPPERGASGTDLHPRADPLHGVVSRMGITYGRAVDAPSDPGPGPGAPPTMTVREELREVTRQRLLSAAEEIFQ